MKENEDIRSVMLSPNDIALRWSCSRSSVDRITARAGFTKLLLGSGRNGLVRYRLDEILAYEQYRSVKTTPK